MQRLSGPRRPKQNIMPLETIQIQTHGERFYPITDSIEQAFAKIGLSTSSGLLHLFIQHTSCALTIS